MTSVATYNKMETSPLLEGTIEIKDYFNKEVSKATNLTELEKNFLSFFALDGIVAASKEYGFYYGDLDPNEIITDFKEIHAYLNSCLLYTSPSPRDRTRSRMPSSA